MLLTRWVTRLLIANVAVFFLQQASPMVERALMFVPAEILSRPWTIVTYMFVHGGFTHILFNMLMLFFFGPRLELELGPRQFLLLYALSGITGALLSFALAPYAAIIGASGAIYGVTLGFAWFWPTSEIYIWGMIPVQARWLVVGLTILSIFGGVGMASDGTAHFAHLGGFLGGFVYLRFFVRRHVLEAVSVPAPAMPSSEEIRRWNAIPTEGMHPVNREELERIREKIRTQGPALLSPTERAFLDRFSQTS